MATADDYRRKARRAGNAAAKAEKASRPTEAALQRNRQRGFEQLASNEDWLNGKPGSQLDQKPSEPPAAASLGRTAQSRWQARVAQMRAAGSR
jgi:hypothetical protein